MIRCKTISSKYNIKLQKMGLKWFRARLSIKKKVYKDQDMIGFYRKISYFESDISAVPRNANSGSSSFLYDSAVNSNNEIAQYDRSKIGLTSQLTPLSHIDSVETDYTIQDIEASTSIESSNIAKELLINGEKSKKVNKNDNNSAIDTTDCSCQDDEIII